MKFKTVAEAFNHYRNMSVAEIEQRAKEIQNQIDTDAEADIEALNIELRGLKEARENIEIRSANPGNGLKVITGMNAQQQQGGVTFGADVYGSKEYRSAFFKTLLGQQLSSVEKAAFDAGMREAEKRTDAFISSSDAAAVLPTETLNEVISKARTMGGILPECRAFNMPTKIAIPVGPPSSAAAWHVEGATVEAEKTVPVSVTFDGYEIIKIFAISAKARKMSITAFEAYLVEELTSCVMRTLEDALVNGTGSGQGTGLLTGITWATSGNNQNAVEVAAANNIGYADVVATVALLKRGYANGAKWAMNNATLYNVFYGMLDQNKRPIFIADPKAEGIGKILGFEVVIDDNMPANTAIFGNFAYMGYNLPEGIAIEVSRESSFRKGLIDYRAMAIADCKPIVNEAFVKLSKAAS